MRASSASTSASVSLIRRLLHLHILITVDGEIRKHFEGGFETQRFALLEINVGHLGLRDGLELLLGDSSAEVAGQNSFHHILANLLSESAADERLRNLSRTEAWDARHLFVSLGDCLKIASDFFGGDFDFNFPGAVRIQGRGAMGVTLMFLSGSFLGGGGCFASLRCGFDHFTWTQSTSSDSLPPGTAAMAKMDHARGSL